MRTEALNKKEHIMLKAHREIDTTCLPSPEMKQAIILYSHEWLDRAIAYQESIGHTIRANKFKQFKKELQAQPEVLLSDCWDSVDAAIDDALTEHVEQL